MMSAKLKDAEKSYIKNEEKEIREAAGAKWGGGRRRRLGESVIDQLWQHFVACEYRDSNDF